MSCFWQGIQRSLIIEDFLPYSNSENIHVVPKLDTLVLFLKKHNYLTKNITCNGEVCSEKMLKENKDAVDEYNLVQINQGYYCSTADPFLFLVCFLFSVNIIHDYNSHTISYEHPAHTRTIYYHSNTSHFVYKKTIIK
jgi:hypothetical protein|tara:strand:+ start:438 stop:851 length:414 start_codon:yes stop_codon:yes gene_type:complete